MSAFSIKFIDVIIGRDSIKFLEMISRTPSHFVLTTKDSVNVSTKVSTNVSTKSSEQADPANTHGCQ